tara:strand:- start:5811 stop:12191 length:6381 start_codon:yes stop_codon:yes gene_type:complete
MGIFGYEPVDLELNSYNNRQAREKQFKAIKDTISNKPELGNNLEEIVNKFGNILPRDVMVGSALMGFTVDNPELSSLVRRQIELDNEKNEAVLKKAGNFGKGFVRSAFVGMDSLAEWLIKRPFQAGVKTLTEAGQSPFAAYAAMFGSLVTGGLGDEVIFNSMGLGKQYSENKKELGPTQAGMAIRKLAKGERVNLGEGFFGNSTLARDTEIYKEVASQIQDPSQLAQIEKVIQQQLGTPITQVERDRVENNLYKGVVVSPGRVAAINIAEPGTDRFKLVSGLIDGVVTLGLDPANLAGGWANTATKAGRQFVTKVNNPGMAKARRVLTADVFQKVNIVNPKGGDDLIRYVDVGDLYLTQPKYTFDELNMLAKERGKRGAFYAREANGNIITNTDYYTRGGASFWPQNLRDSARGQIKVFDPGGPSPYTKTLGGYDILIENTPVRAKGFSKERIFIDRDKLLKSRIFKNADGTYGTDGAALKGKKFASEEEIIDFVLAHEAEHALNYIGQGDKTVQKLHAAKVKEMRRAKELGVDQTDNYAEVNRKYERAINEKVLTELENGTIRNYRGRSIDVNKMNSGLSRVLRPSLNKTVFEDWHSTTGKKIYDFLYDNIQKGGIDYEAIRKILPDVSPATKGRILNAANGDEIGDIIAKEVRAGNISKRLDPYSFTFRGGVSRRLGKVFGTNNKLLDDGSRIDFSDMGDFLGVGAVIGRKSTDNAISRMFKTIAPGNINVYSHTVGYKQMEDLISALPFSKKQKKKLYDELIQSNTNIQQGMLEGRKYSRIRITEEMYNLLLGSKENPGGVLTELNKLMKAKGYGKEVSSGITKFIAEVRESRRYWQSLVGDEIVDVGFTGAKSTRPGASALGSAQAQLKLDELDGLVNKADSDAIQDFFYRNYDGDKEIAQPTAQLMTEMLTGNIPLPDMREVYRILGEFRNNLYKLTGLSRLPFTPSRIDLPQVLSKENKFFKLVDSVYDDDFAIAARENKEFAEFLSKWEYPDYATLQKRGDIKDFRKYVEKAQQTARDELYDAYKKFTGKDAPKQFDGELLSIFGSLDETEMIQSAANAGNIASNAVSQRIARLFYRVDKSATENNRLVNTAITRYANNIVSQAWKPLQLLRFAWTARVISEEQLRMYAADMGNMWTSPWSLFAYAFGKKAGKDILGSDIQMSLIHKMAMSKGSQGLIMRKGTSIDRFYDVVRKELSLGETASRSRYAQGWATELTQLANDDLSVAIAQVMTNKSKQFKSLDDIAKHLTNESNKGDILYESFKDWIDSGDLISGPTRQKIGNDLDRTLEYLESIQARIVDKTGGTFKKYILKDGKKIEIPLNVMYRNSADPNGLPLRMYYEIDELNSSRRFIDGIAKREISFLKTKPGSNVEEFRRIKLGGESMSDKNYDELVKELARQVEYGPEIVKVSRRLDKTGTLSDVVIDKSVKATNALFDLFMSAPTNKLSRSPAFKQFYWRRVSESAKGLEPRALQKVIQQAKKAKVDKKVIRQLEATPGTVGGITEAGLKDFDELAKSFALTDVQDLLYDINRRSQFSEALELLFPFAEVHKEIAGTWTRLIKDNPTKLRKMYITVDSLKESDPTGFDVLGGDSSDQNSSFIYTDPLTQEQVYVIPAFDPVFNNIFQNITNIPGSTSQQNINNQLQGDDPRFQELLQEGMPNVGADVRMRTIGFTSSANIVAGGVLPGVGPAIQIPARFLLPNKKEKSAIYQTIFPYGKGDFISTFVPSWLQKVIGAFEAGTDEWNRAYTNTSKDILRAKVLSGDIVINSQDDLLEALNVIKRQATFMTILRGVVQGVSLTGGSFRFEAAVSPGGDLYCDLGRMRDLGIDPEGKYFAFNVLASAYYRIYSENEGDQVKTMQEFTNLFGYDPTALLISKSKEITRTPYTIDNLDYAKTNETMQYAFENHPNVAYYLSPDIPIDEFSYQGFVDAFDEDNILGMVARQDLTLSEWALLYNQVAGKFAMENFRREVSNVGGSNYVGSDKIRNELLGRANDSIVEMFPGYDVRPRTIGTADYEQLEREIRRMINDPQIPQNSEMVIATKVYLESLDVFRSKLQVKLNSPDVSDKNYFGYEARRALEEKAKELYTRYPQFYFIYNDIFRPQLQENVSKLLQEGAGLP